VEDLEAVGGGRRGGEPSQARRVSGDGELVRLSAAGSSAYRHSPISSADLKISVDTRCLVSARISCPVCELRRKHSPLQARCSLPHAFWVSSKLPVMPREGPSPLFLVTSLPMPR